MLSSSSLLTVSYDFYHNISRHAVCCSFLPVVSLHFILAYKISLILGINCSSQLCFCFCIMSRMLLFQLLSLRLMYPTTTTTTVVLRPFVRTRVSRYQKKDSPTHHPDHHPIFIIFFHLPLSVASSLFKLRPWQSLAIFLHNLFPCPLWSTSWSGALHLIFHTFLHLISVFFLQHMPILSQPVLL